MLTVFCNKTILHYNTNVKKNLFLFFIFFSATSMAQTNYTGNVALVDSFMTGQANIRNFNGNVLIAKSGDVIYKKSFGYRNYDTKELLNDSTIFEIASVSKQFTAMGILLLIQKGKLKFTDTLRAFFPELPYHNITIKDLIIHTSGLPDYLFAMIKKWDHSKVAFNDDLIKFLADEKIPPNFRPGERVEYSNAAYSLMASIIEKISGQSFNKYMDENIFKPLGMNLSLVYNTRRSLKNILPNYAFGYVYSDSLNKYVLPDSVPRFSFVYFLDGIVGDGIINSTSGDMLKWDRALKNNSLLNESLQKEMFSPHSLFDTAQNIRYGYGVFIDSGNLGKRIFHGGTWPGYSTNLTRFVDDDITIILLSNNETYASTIATTIGNILLGGMTVLPYEHTEVKIVGRNLSKYTGIYSVPSGVEFELVLKSGKLYERTAAKDIELKPESDFKFFWSEGSDTQIEFQLDDSGNVEKVFIIDTGMKVEIKRK